MPKKLKQIGLAKCPLINCVYNKALVCHDVTTNRGNSDARCRRLTTGDMRHLVTPIAPTGA